MRRWQKGQSKNIEDRNVSRSILSLVLLALFSTHGGTRMDECTLDGIICCNHLYRERMHWMESLDRKSYWCSHYCPRETSCNYFDIVAIQSME